MIKLSKPTLSNFKITKTWLLIGAGVAVFLLILAFGIVRQVQAEQVQTALDNQKRAEYVSLVTERDNLKKQNQGLQNDLTLAKASKGSVCDWVRSMAADKTHRLTVPPLCVK